MEPDDDWAPLPGDPAAAHPGECAAPTRKPQGRVPKPTLRPREPGAPAPTPPTAEQRAAAERALAELQARLRSAPDTADPVRRAFARASRKAAATAAFDRDNEPEPPSPVVPDADRTPGVVATTYATDRDPREDEPWFQQLPERERQRLAAEWHAERHRFDTLRSDHWRDVRRAAWQGGLLFLAIAVLQAPWLWSLALAAELVLGGAVAAATARAIGGGRFVFATAGATTFLLVIGGSLGIGLFSPLSLSLILMASYGMGLLGMDREMRQRGGFSPRN